jgi:hypothetical protein
MQGSNATEQRQGANSQPREDLVLLSNTMYSSIYLDSVACLQARKEEIAVETMDFLFVGDLSTFIL